MNKKLKLVFHILIGIAGIIFVLSFMDMMFSIQYANREIPDETESNVSVFEYKLKHRAYGEITNSYFTDRMQSMEVPEGEEKIYLTAEYANTAFMKRLYEEKKDEKMVKSCQERLADLSSKLGEYVHATVEIDEMIQKAP